MQFDTDVLIWLLRGNLRAVRAVETANHRAVSAVTYMELIQGARDRGELKTIRSFLADHGFRVVPLSENIGHRACMYLETLALIAGMRLADALVAATAVESGLPLCSGDRRHYRFIRDLELRTFRP